MKKFIPFILALITLSACSPEKGANKEFIKASQSMTIAKQNAKDMNFKSAYKNASDALSIIEQIPQKYPSTTLAVNIMTSSKDFKLTDISLSDIKNIYLPNWNLYSGDYFGSYNLPWFIFLQNHLTDEALATKIASLYVNKTDFPAPKTASEKIVFDSLTSQKQSPLKNKQLFKRTTLEKNLPMIASDNGDILAKRTKITPLDEKEKIDIIKKANMQILLIASNIEKIKEFIWSADILYKAGMDKELDNLIDEAIFKIGKITSKNLKDEAFSNLSVALIRLQRQDKALLCAMNMSNPDKKDEIFTNIALSFAIDKRFADLENIASFIKNKEILDKINFVTISELISTKQIDKALKKALLITNPQAKNNALCLIAMKNNKVLDLIDFSKAQPAYIYALHKSIFENNPPIFLNKWIAPSNANSQLLAEVLTDFVCYFAQNSKLAKANKIAQTLTDAPSAALSYQIIGIKLALSGNKEQAKNAFNIAKNATLAQKNDLFNAINRQAFALTLAKMYDEAFLFAEEISSNEKNKADTICGILSILISQEGIDAIKKYESFYTNYLEKRKFK